MNQIIRTPEGALTVIRATAEKLLQEGVISGTLDGDMHATSAATVKAAIMAAAVCDFCSVPGASHYYDVPDFGITTNALSYGPTRSTGGWMACDACDELVRGNKRKALIDRAVETMAFPKFTRRAIAEMYEKFWQGMDDRSTAIGIAEAVGEFVDDRLPDGAALVPEMSDRDVRVETMAKVMNLTAAEIRDVVAGKIDRHVVEKLAAWRRATGPGDRFDARTLVDLLGDRGPRKPLAPVVPHWQIALDRKFEAMTSLAAYLQSGQVHQFFPEAVDMNDRAAVEKMVRMAKNRSVLDELGFGNDVKYLKAAQAYSFNAETIGAIREAARLISDDTPLSSIETPSTGAGWFWFAEPIPVQASPIATDRVHALLWGWTNRRRKVHRLTLDDATLRALGPADVARLKEFSAVAEAGVAFTEPQLKELGGILRRSGVQTTAEYDRRIQTETIDEASISFSAYVVDERGRYLKAGTIAPSTRWYWPVDATLREMLDGNGRSWDADYGPGSALADDPLLVGRDATLLCVRELSTFFAMACVWFRQTVAASGKKRGEPVLSTADGHVERHAKKRYVREHKLSDPPTVQVVALRRTARVGAAEQTRAERASAREYSCRWIVRGHPRLQACGPGRKDRKTIWIEAHPAGPEGKPFRTREKVFAVVR